MSKCSCCKQEITTAGCGCDVRLANEGLRDYARLLELEDGAETPEILVPLDLSDALAMIDRLRQQIVLLQEAQDKILRLCEDCGEEGLACFKEKEEQIAALDDAIGEYHLEERDLRKQIAALKEENKHLRDDNDCFRQGSQGQKEALRGEEVKG